MVCAQRQAALGFLWRVASFAISVAITLILIRVVPNWIDYLHPVYLLYAVASYVLAAILHEGGHALAALAVRWRIFALAVGPVSIRITPFAIRYGAFLPGAVGAVLALPKSLKDATASKTLLVFSGGILANLCTGTLAAVCWIYMPLSALAIFAGVSLLLAFHNVLPFSFGVGIRSDGWQMLNTVRKGRGYSALEFDVYTLQALTVCGQAAAAWPADTAARVVSETGEGEIAFYRHLILLDWYLEQQDFAAAGRELELAGGFLDAMPYLKDVLKLTEAFFVGHYLKDALQAKDILNSIGPFSGVWRYYYLRARAAACASEGDGHGALGMIGDAEKLLRRVLPFMRENEIITLAEIRDALPTKTMNT